MLFRASNPNSPPPISWKNCFLLLLRGGCLTVPLVDLILNWSPSSHKEVLDTEIQFFHERVTKNDPKLLIDCIQRMASGEAPFFPTTLSLVYDKLVEKAFTKQSPFGSGPEVFSAGDNYFVKPTAFPEASAFTFSIPPPLIADTVASSSNLQAPASTCGPAPPSTTPNSTWLKCVQCGEVARLRDLRGGLRCPKCPKAGKIPAPLMKCTSCNAVHESRREDCAKKKCRKRFM